NTFSGNQASQKGGALFNVGTLYAVNNTFVGNTATGNSGTGGAIFGSFAPTEVLTSNTFTGNSATVSGGALAGASSFFSLFNTLISGNSAPAFPDVDVSLLASNTNSVIGGPASSLLQYSGGTPVLKNNGGPTPTVALIGSATSAAVGTGATPLTTLTSPMSAASTTAIVGDYKVLTLGEYVQIDSEIVQVAGLNNGTNVTVARNQLGTTATSHSVGAALRPFDQRGVFRNANPDIGAFETQIATVSAALPSGVYTGSPFTVTSASATNSANQIVADFGNPSLAYTYYAGTLTAGDLAGATPLSGAPNQVGAYTVVAALKSFPGYRDAVSNPVHFDITPATLTITASNNTKTYDATTSASAVPTVSGLLGSDTATNLSETYVSKDVLGAGKSTLVVASYTINDGNGGKNYTVVTKAGTGTITAAPLTISATSNTRAYDTTTSAAAVPTASGLLGTDKVSGLAEAYTSKNVLGTGKSTLQVTAFTVQDGNNGNNYSVTTVTASGTVTPASLTISATANTRIYDAGTSASATPTALGFLGSDSLSSATEAYASKDVKGKDGSTLLVTGYAIADGNDGGNYEVTTVTAAGTITPASLTIAAVYNTKVFDGTTSAAAIPAVSGQLGTDSVSGLAEVYASPNVLGYNKSLLSVAPGYSVNDGNNGANYVVSTTTSPGTITFAPSKLVLQAPVPTTGLAGSTLNPAIKVAVQDKAGNLVDSESSILSMSIASGPAGSKLNGTTEVSVVGGVAVFNNLILNTAGNYRLKATYGALPSINTGTIAITPAAAAKIMFTQTPAETVAAGATLPFKVSVQDAFGNVVTSDNSQVTLTLSGGTFANGATTAVATANKGVASFSGLTITVPGNYSIAATDGDLADPAFDLTVTHAAASKVVYQTAPPVTGTAGVSFSPVIVAVQDRFGNVVTSDNSSTVTLTLNTGVFASNSNTASTIVTGGRATFSGPGLDLAINKSARYSIKATAGSLTSTTSSISISAAAATKVVLTQSPAATVAAGTSLTFRGAIQDLFGNVVTTDSSVVTVTLDTGTFAKGQSTVQSSANKGLFTFSSLAINKVGSYQLAFTSGDLTDPVFDLTVVPANAAKVVYQSAPPTTGTAGESFSPVVVAVQDRFGNVVTSDDSSTVTLTLNSGVFASNSNSVATTVVGGLATFNGPGLDLAINKSGKYAIKATSGTLTSTTSSITISAATAAKLSLTQTPAATVAAGAALTFKGAIQDQFGNVVITDASDVTLTLDTGTFANGSSTAVATASKGLFTFAGLAVNTAGNYQAAFSDGELAGTSFDLAIIPATARKLLILSVPSSGTVNSSLSAMSIAITDQFGNIVTSASNSITVAIATKPTGGGFTPDSVLTVAAVDGVVTFSNVALNKVGNYTLRFSGTGLSSATTTTIVIG
ncbi:MAG: hypothetical protein JSS02_24330, partial [Planctomycetes bacterium]|nr:hypothetical protein [Planctomycetota bacterium]